MSGKKARIRFLEATLHEETADRIATQDCLHRIRALLTGRVPHGEIGITFDGWVDHVARLVREAYPLDAGPSVVVVEGEAK